MATATPGAASVDDYLAAQPDQHRATLVTVRRLILEAVPEAVEAVRYGMPAYRFPNGRPVYFAGWKQHVSLHDIPPFDGELETHVAPYRSGKDTLKFPYREAMPLDLITRTMRAIAERPT